ncbi:hypothetical protein AB0O28_27895 [Microbispora sp. NPDC088329]|uniref:hypothetical protein n=1 Tax=Microbispora sp. NPDC088329 TaxID=3154869 RepID=UPI0034335F4B
MATPREIALPHRAPAVLFDEARQQPRAQCPMLTGADAGARPLPCLLVIPEPLVTGRGARTPRCGRMASPPPASAAEVATTVAMCC